MAPGGGIPPGSAPDPLGKGGSRSPGKGGFQIPWEKGDPAGINPGSPGKGGFQIPCRKGGSRWDPPRIPWGKGGSRSPGERGVPDPLGKGGIPAGSTPDPLGKGGSRSPGKGGFRRESGFDAWERRIPDPSRNPGRIPWERRIPDPSRIPGRIPVETGDPLGKERIPLGVDAGSPGRRGDPAGGQRGSRWIPAGSEAKPAPKVPFLAPISPLSRSPSRPLGIRTRDSSGIGVLFPFSRFFPVFLVFFPFFSWFFLFFSRFFLFFPGFSRFFPSFSRFFPSFFPVFPPPQGSPPPLFVTLLPTESPDWGGGWNFGSSFPKKKKTKSFPKATTRCSKKPPKTPKLP
ncbi:collagen alpha-1(III) chain-like [Corvus moneduloides]|uniref:collagen alpha-1(III) chain-like n=1 Tax=Corvus moneduloides TaxID=1196302 RepID=UPI001363EED1|nr:collagen alpha-1(III) chain-like [Corvus moneduloides]